MTDKEEREAMTKRADQVQKGDTLVAKDGTLLKVRRISKGVTTGGICFEHEQGYSEVHKATDVEVAQA